jgi:uncharacterized protein YdaU (DUF1376 family)
MATEKAPAFQFYPADFLSDGRVMQMTLAECGAYIRLLCVAWIEGGLPADQDRLAQILGLAPRSFLKLWPALQPCFQEHDGRLTQKRLEHERAKQATYREQQRQKGLASARLRQAYQGGSPDDSPPPPNGNRGSTAVPTAAPTAVQPSPQPEGQPNGNRASTDRATERQPTGNFSVFGLPSSKKDREILSDLSRDPFTDDAITERAGRFIERYGDLYQQHRHAHYHSKPRRDYQAAVELCTTWRDDTRLDKLAAIFLTTDHAFAAEGSRTIPQFGALASWCDSKLAEWERQRGIA